MIMYNNTALCIVTLGTLVTCDCLQSSAVREINRQNEAMTCLLILSTASLYIARLTNCSGFTR